MLRYHRIHTASDPALSKMQILYEGSFPVHERRRWEQLKGSILQQEAMQCLAIYDAEEVIGMLVCWQFSTFCFIEHLAVDPKRRGEQYGQRIMRWLLEKSNPLPVLLEVEPPADEWSRRRIGFYERLGFTLLPYAYRQPCYHEPGTFHDLKLMGYGDWADEGTIEKAVSLIHRQVYAYER
jgi:ribosomal protein S18 acetylase RimI-like enzyme